MPSLHRVTVGRTREVRGPDALERGFVGLTIMAAAVLAIGYGIHQMRMVKVTEAIVLARQPQIDETLYRAAHGTWPKTGDPSIVAGAQATGAVGHYVTAAHLARHGVITMRLSLGQEPFRTIAHELGEDEPSSGRLSFRPQLLGVPGFQAVTMLCGYARPVGGKTLPGANNGTTLSRQDVPPLCR